jgi:DNA-binding CsgD family transcriptional regulator
VSDGKVYEPKPPRARPTSRPSKAPTPPTSSGGTPIIRQDIALELVAECEASRRLQKISQLTPREREVLGHAALGYADQEIAGRMRITPRTVRHYFTTLFQKFGVRNRIDVAMTGMLAHVANCEECFQALVAYQHGPVATPPDMTQRTSTTPTTRTRATPIRRATA